MSSIAGKTVSWIQLLIHYTSLKVWSTLARKDRQWKVCQASTHFLPTVLLHGGSFWSFLCQVPSARSHLSHGNLAAHKTTGLLKQKEENKQQQQRNNATPPPPPTHTHPTPGMFAHILLKNIRGNVDSQTPPLSEFGKITKFYESNVPALLSHPTKFHQMKRQQMIHRASSKFRSLSLFIPKCNTVIWYGHSTLATNTE